MDGRDVAGARAWRRMLRAPWVVAGAVATVLFGSSATVASALDQANAAPGHTVAAVVSTTAATGETGRFVNRWRP
ncbi:hypothetical protein [Streptomyces botrytidirepellens]|uniref:Uncharacterized protein n=1 Tax=Streptomyces botrytidirepellens TaxID=2486417 RepID=A0A3M8TIN5_9ACTN|nr:hypothetical protein [Streptomyces botrytidirepellens]RNF92935.1 hypothetical protein EEJ42_39285 [Streptomyces botrytidirepellens]